MAVIWVAVCLPSVSSDLLCHEFPPHSVLLIITISFSPLSPCCPLQHCQRTQVWCFYPSWLILILFIWRPFFLKALFAGTGTLHTNKKQVDLLVYIQKKAVHTCMQRECWIKNSHLQFIAKEFAVVYWCIFVNIITRLLWTENFRVRMTKKPFSTKSSWVPTSQYDKCSSYRGKWKIRAWRQQFQVIIW